MAIAHSRDKHPRLGNRFTDEVTGKRALALTGSDARRPSNDLATLVQASAPARLLACLERTMQPASAMAIEIDDTKFQQILDVTLGSQRIGPREIRTVLLIAQFAAAVDLDDDPAEGTTLRALTSRLCEWGGIPADSVPVLSPIPTDDEERAARISTLVRQLPTTGARDLAFALAYLIIVADLEAAPIEEAVLEQLQRALTIPADRAGYLACAIAAIVTPGEAAGATAVVARTC